MDAVDIPNPPPFSPPRVVVHGSEAFDRTLVEIPNPIALGNVGALDVGYVPQEFQSRFSLGSGLVEAFQELREELFPLPMRKESKKLERGSGFKKTATPPAMTTGCESFLALLNSGILPISSMVSMLR